MDEIEEIVIILEILKRRRGLPAVPVFLPAAAPSDDGSIQEEEGAAVRSEGEESYGTEGFDSVGTGSSDISVYRHPYIGQGT
jgi:hypothetical protein